MGFFGLSEAMGIAVAPLLGGILLDAFPASPELVWAPLASVAFVAPPAHSMPSMLDRAGS
jgi:hypothetical protein